MTQWSEIKDSTSGRGGVLLKASRDQCKSSIIWQTIVSQWPWEKVVDRYKIYQMNKKIIQNSILHNAFSLICKLWFYFCRLFTFFFIPRRSTVTVIATPPCKFCYPASMLQDMSASFHWLGMNTSVWDLNCLVVSKWRKASSRLYRKICQMNSMPDNNIPMCLLFRSNKSGHTWTKYRSGHILPGPNDYRYAQLCEVISLRCKATMTGYVIIRKSGGSSQHFDLAHMTCQKLAEFSTKTDNFYLNTWHQISSHFSKNYCWMDTWHQIAPERFVHFWGGDPPQTFPLFIFHLLIYFYTLH